MHLTWHQWMDKVDAIIWKRLGCGAMDLDDFCYRDWYDSGASPAEAARAAIRNAAGLD